MSPFVSFEITMPRNRSKWDITNNIHALVIEINTL
jgi:hypothetical protein